MSIPSRPCQIIPFPDVRLWSRIAKRYVEYYVAGDPRAACYYLASELDCQKLSRSPAGLKQAIVKEYRKRGFPGEIVYH
ncbi:hypothetical protein F6R98_00920 [Candidatus Methylospira mobilis]|uniref:Uncharacterized protein n=1 Tax=Candidatus Methylospira mobilis TaxID=1808979 RepID=A0A5Q0BCW4_9GAMM|nr:hypothetical protein [Candidatus Methylospira mobilis]QFY41359.1 hypothetical protein F6R98_00920 [Candidatus Methylospira mobilis]WNV05414.1 hypothetical protein RP726_03125 [Candidatus Methylospira mobilis]